MFALDHIVIAAKDPELAAKEFCQKHDVIAIPGGKHEDWGTYNYLAYFNNRCYIEWLGIYDETKAKKATNPLIPQLLKTFQTHGEVPYQIALRTNNLGRQVEHLKANAIAHIGPLPGSRKKLDGEMLQWKMLFPKPKNEIFHPFIIEWGETINLPPEATQINQKNIADITLRAELMDGLQNIYQLESVNNQIILENCKITLDSTVNLVALQLDKE